MATSKKKSDSLEKRITSIRPVTIAMFIVMLPIAIEMAFLFNVFLKDIVTISQARFVASGFIGIAIGVSMMLASIHSDLIADLKFKINEETTLRIPEVFYFLSFIGMLILFEVPDFKGDSFGWYFGRIFGAATYSTVEYIFSKLFINKFKSDKAKFNPNKNK